MKIRCPKCEFVIVLGDEAALEISLNVKCPNCKTSYTFKSELSISESSGRENIIICKRCGSKNEAQNKECFDCGEPLISNKTNNETGKTDSKIGFIENNVKEEKPKKTLSSVLLWFFGFLFIAMGLSGLYQDPFISIIYIMISFFITPFTYSKIESLFNFKSSSKTRVIIVLCLFLLIPFVPKKEMKTKETDVQKSELKMPVENKAATVNRTTTIPKRDCWELGYKFGYCATLALHGFECRPEDDVVIPVECRGDNRETNMGIKSGTEKAFDKLGLPKK